MMKATSLFMAKRRAGIFDFDYLGRYGSEFSALRERNDPSCLLVIYKCLHAWDIPAELLNSAHI